MGGSERLYDVFQALAGVSNTAFSIADRWKQAAADAKLRSDELDLMYASGNFIQGLSGRNDYENFESDWWRERNRLYADAKKGARGSYALRGLEQMYAQHDVRQKLAIQAAAAKSAGDHANVLDENNRGRIAEMPLGGQQRFDMMQSILREQYKSGRTDHQTYAVRSLGDMTDVIYTDGLKLIDEAIADTADTEADPLSRIRQAVAGMNMDAYQFTVIDPNTGAVADRSGDVPREGIREKLLAEAGTQWNGRVTQIRSDNDNRLSVLYGQLKGLPEGSWNAAADQALALINRDMGGYRLSPEDRKKWIDAFQRIKADLSESPDKAKTTMWKNILETDMAAFIQAGIRGASGDQKGMRTMYDAFDKWLEESLEKLQREGYTGGTADMRFEFAETIGKFFPAAEKALPDQLKGALNDAKQFVEGMYGTPANPVTSTLSEKYPGMKESIAGAVVEQLRDWLFGNDLSLMPLETASAQINAIVDAQVIKELDVLRKDPETGKLGYERRGGESEEALLARAAKALENRELVWTSENGTLRYALGTAEGVAEVQGRLRDKMAAALKAEGIAPGEINMEMTESAAERDKDATPVFSARGIQYRFQSDGKTLSPQTRAAGSGEWGPYTPPPAAEPPASSVTHPDGSAKQEQAAVRREIQSVISSNRKHAAITPGGMDAVAWGHMLGRGAAFQYLEHLRKTDPDAYEEYKRRLETEGRR
jgi:hypothetical protein